MLLLTLDLLQGSIELAKSQNIVPLDNPYIHYDGVFYPTITPMLVTFDRHKAAVYNNTESGIYGAWIYQWVSTQTGIRIRLKTNSPTIKFTFQQRSGGGTIGASPTNGFSVFADSVLNGTFSSLVFTINNPNPGNSTFYEVSLPNLWAVDLIGIELASTYFLNDPGALVKPVYVAIGDSKTHGTGQYVSSAKTYPFQLANLMKWDLHNIAVAGATTGWAMALNIQGKQVDNITIEIGFNDWKYLSDALAVRQTQYEKLIDSLRCYLPNANIYCITPCVSTDPSGAAPYSLEDFRTMVETIVKLRKQTDSKLFLFPGPAVSDATMLASGDMVHLSESGALMLANNLKAAINNPASVLTSNQPGISMQRKTKINYICSSEIFVTTNGEGYFSFELFTTDGKRLAIVENIFLKEGQNEVSWSPSGLFIGNAYLVSIKQNELIEGTQIMLLDK